MNKLLFAVIAVIVFFLFSVGTSIAEPTQPNEVGLYMAPDGFSETGTYVIGELVDVYLLLTRPTDVNNDNLPYATVDAFELTLNFNPVPNNDLILLATEFPSRSINIGDNSDIKQGFLEYVVGVDFNFPLQVTDESVVLLTFTFINNSITPTEVTLGPTSKPGIAGQMAFESETGQLRVMYPVSGSPDAPVFIFNGEAVFDRGAVTVENASFGSVKTLYR